MATNEIYSRNKPTKRYTCPARLLYARLIDETVAYGAVSLEILRGSSVHSMSAALRLVISSGTRLVHEVGERYAASIRV